MPDHSYPLVDILFSEKNSEKRGISNRRTQGKYPTTAALGVHLLIHYYLRSKRPGPAFEKIDELSNTLHSSGLASTTSKGTFLACLSNTSNSMTCLRHTDMPPGNVCIRNSSSVWLTLWYHGRRLYRRDIYPRTI